MRDGEYKTSETRSCMEKGVRRISDITATNQLTTVLALHYTMSCVVCARLCVCVRVCVSACVRACVRACDH